MGADFESTAKYSVDVSDLKKGIQDANRAIREANSEYRAAANGTKQWEQSAAGAAAKQKQLASVVEAQKAKLANLKEEYKQVAAAEGEDSKAASDLRIKMNNLQGEINKSETALKKTTHSLGEMGKKAAGAGKNLAAGLGKGLKVAAKGLAVAAGAATAAAVGIFKIADSSASAGKDINNMSQKLNMSKQGYQEWSYALKKSGTSIDVMKIGMKKMQQAMGDMKDANSAGAKSFAAIGVSFDEIKNKSPEEALELSIKKLQEMPAGAARSNAALKLFGKGAQELQPLLNKTGAETDELKKRAHDMGLVLSDEQVDNSVKFKSAMGKIKDTMEGLKLQLASTFVPSLADGMSAVLDFAKGTEGAEDKMKKAIGSLAGTITTTLSQFISKGASVIAALAQGITSSLPTLLNAIVGIIPPIINTIISILPALLTAGVQMITSLIQGITNALPQLIPAIISALQNMVQTLLDSIPLLLDAGLQLMTGLVEEILAAVPQLVPIIISAIQGMVRALFDSLSLFLDAGLQLIVGLVDGLLAALPQLTAALPDIIDAIIRFVISAIPQIIQAGIQLFMGLVQAIPAAITSIVAVLPQIIESVINGLLEAIPALIEAGIALFLALIDALPQIITSIVQALPQIISGIISGLMRAIPQLIQAGIQLLVAIVKNIPAIIAGIIKAIPQIISALVSGIGSGVGQMAQAGLNLIQGLINGITDAAAWVFDQIKGFCGGIIDAVKGLFGIKSPSTVMHKIGKYISQGLGNGIKSGSKEAIKKAKAAAKNIKDAMSAAVLGDIKKTNKAISALYKTLPKVADSAISKSVKTLKKKTNELNKVLADLKAAEKDLESKRAQKAAYKDSVTNTFTDYSNITTIKGAHSAQDFSDRLTNRLSLAKTFAANIRKLKGLGLNQAAITEILGMGIKDGNKVAESLLTGATKGAISEINNTMAQLTSTGAGLGKELSGQFFDSGIQAAEGLVAGLKKSQKDIEKAMTKVAETMVKTIKKKLKIKSPSQVFEGLGDFSMRGYVGGVLNGMKSGTAQIGAAFGKLTASVAPELNGSFGSLNGAARANTQQANTTNIYQTINSPKPVSAIDTFRYTKTASLIASPMGA